jgi:hypothetical protein
MLSQYLSSLLSLLVVVYLHSLMNRTTKAQELKVIKCVDETRQTNARSSLSINDGPSKELIKSLFLNASVSVNADFLKFNRTKPVVNAARSMIPGHSSSDIRLFLSDSFLLRLEICITINIQLLRVFFF